MTVSTVQYIRKPLYVDAVRITAANFDEIVSWCQGEVRQDTVSGKQKKYIRIRVHNPKNVRQTQAFVGDWLLYTEKGYKVYTNRAFLTSFDEAPPSGPEKTEEKLDDPVFGSEEVLPGVTLNELIELYRQHPHLIKSNEAPHSSSGSEDKAA